MTEIRKVNLNHVERGVEEALRNFAGRGAAPPLVREPAAKRAHERCFIGEMKAVAPIFQKLRSAEPDENCRLRLC
jgi:hypothetical protein